MGGSQEPYKMRKDSTQTQKGAEQTEDIIIQFCIIKASKSFGARWTWVQILIYSGLVALGKSLT
jgi:hypothetical protein